MKFLFVTYRWGADIYGGAEIHHRRLVYDLVELGHQVEVWTTTGKDISPAAHWGVDWSEHYPPGDTVENGVRVRRFPLDPVNKLMVQMAAKFLQRQIEKEWSNGSLDALDNLAVSQLENERSTIHLLDGWHSVELSGDGGVARWTFRQCRLSVTPGCASGQLRLNGSAPRALKMMITDDAGNTTTHAVNGPFSIETSIHSNRPGVSLIKITVDRALRPVMDHRTLGVYITGIEWRPDSDANRSVWANLWDDHRAVGRQNPEPWWELLWHQAERRNQSLGAMFDWVRGPRCTGLRKALRGVKDGYDAVIAANLPWSIIPMVAEECSLPMMAMALWHIEDDYYYWPHYIDALKKARLVLANTPYSADKFFVPRGIPAVFVGPGVPLPPEPPKDFSPLAWKKKIGLLPNESMILTVCRKSPEKRYEIVAEAVGRLRKAGRPVRFVMIGPDADHRALPEHAIYLGRQSDEELDCAYRSCDAFVLMSESESFGMVLAEAWLRGKPVVANEICGPSASLVDAGRDGLLARDAESLAGALATLLDHPARAEAMGKAGQEKARREFVQRAATLRFLDAAEQTLSGHSVS